MKNETFRRQLWDLQDRVMKSYHLQGWDWWEAWSKGRVPAMWEDWTVADYRLAIGWLQRLLDNKMLRTLLP